MGMKCYLIPILLSNSLMTSDVEPFYVFIGHLFVLFGEMAIWVLCPLFKIGLFVVLLLSRPWELLFPSLSLVLNEMLLSYIDMFIRGEGEEESRNTEHQDSLSLHRIKAGLPAYEALHSMALPACSVCFSAPDQPRALVYSFICILQMPGELWHLQTFVELRPYPPCEGSPDPHHLC